MIGIKIIIQFIGTGIISIISLGILAITARFYGPRVLGEVNYCLSVLGLFLIFSDLGFSRAHIKFVSDKLKIGEKIGVFFIIKAILFTIFFLSALAYFFLINKSSDIQNAVFLILLLNEFLYRLGVSMLSTFEGMQMVTVENLVLGAGKFIKFLAVIIFIFISRSALGLSVTYLIEAFAVVFISFFFLKKYAPFKFNKKIFRQYFGYSLPFFVIYPFSYIQGNIDSVLLKIFWNTTVVGYYSAAIGLAAFVKTLYGVLITLFFPKMSEIYAKGNQAYNKVQAYTDMASKYLLMIFLPLIFCLHIFREEFIGVILGKQFLPSINIFSLSLLGILVLMISSPYDYVIYAGGKHKIWAPLTIITTVIVLILQIILVPKELFSIPMLGWGAIGTVTANVIVWFLSLLIQIYLIRKMLKIKFYNKNLLIITFGTIFLVIFQMLGIADKGLLSKAIFYFSFVALFYWFCVFKKIFTSEDRKYFKMVVKFKNIIYEGLSEFRKNNSFF